MRKPEINRRAAIGSVVAMAWMVAWWHWQGPMTVVLIFAVVAATVYVILDD